MIAQITIGRGNNRRTLVRNRNRAESIQLGQALRRHLGIALHDEGTSKRRKAA